MILFLLRALNTAAKDVLFMPSINISDVPREYVHDRYAPQELGFFIRKPQFDNIYFYKPPIAKQMNDQNLELPFKGSLWDWTSKFVRGVAQDTKSTIRNLCYLEVVGRTYTLPGRSVRKVRWFEAVIDDLISIPEVIQRTLEKELMAVNPNIFVNQPADGYKHLPPPMLAYGPDSKFAYEFPEVSCETQKDRKYIVDHWNEPDMFHICDVKHVRKTRAKKFAQLRYDKALDQLLKALIGPKCIKCPSAIVNVMSRYQWQRRDKTKATMMEMLEACKWVVPETIGEFTQESFEEYEAYAASEFEVTGQVEPARAGFMEPQAGNWR